MNAPLLSLLLACYLCFGTAAATQKVRIMTTPGDGAVPDAEIDQNGMIHLAYVVGEDVFYATSANSGSSFSKSIRVNEEPKTAHPANMFRGPDLAIGKAGRVHVIWYVNSYQRKLPQDQWGVFYSHIDPGQNTFGPSVNLNHKPSDNYSLAADQKGNVAVVWMAGKLFVNTSGNNGNAFSPPELIENADPCECCASRASFSSTGALMIDYRDKASNIRDMHLLARSSGSLAFVKEKISGIPWEVMGCPMTGTFLSAGKRAELVAWETKGQISYARIDATTGKLKSKEIKAAERGKWPIILEGSDGSVLVSWKNDSRLHWQLFAADDQPIGKSESRLTPNSTRHAGVAVPNGFLLID